MKKLSKFAIMAMVALSLTACSDDKNEPNIEPSFPLSKGIVGEWLLSSSTKNEWTVYELNQSQLMTMDWYVNNSLISGTGMCSINDEKSTLTATINDGRGNYIYLDWIATKILDHQIDIKVYSHSGNTFVGNESLYRIIDTQEGAFGSTITPEYRRLTGTTDLYDFKSLDSSVATVNSAGDIKCVGAGSTFIVFNTSKGYACVRINVSDKPMSLSEQILGTWIVDMKGDTWERDTFGENGYFYAQWSREIIYPTTNESGTGKYTVDEKNQILYVSATTPYGQKIDVEYHITYIDGFSFDVDIYQRNEKLRALYYQRMIASETFKVGATFQPSYQSLVGSAKITGYKSHDEAVAKVNATTGKITGVAAGMTYIDVITNNGTAVVEVTVTGASGNNGNTETVKDLFPDYSVLIGMNRNQVVSKMGKQPDYTTDQAYSFFYYDKKGVKMVSAYFTDFITNFENCHSVVTMLDETMSTAEVTKYLKEKYNYYPEYSTADELVFAPTDGSMGIYYEVEDNMVMYISMLDARINNIDFGVSKKGAAKLKAGAAEAKKLKSLARKK